MKAQRVYTHRSPQRSAVLSQRPVLQKSTTKPFFGAYRQHETADLPSNRVGSPRLHRITIVQSVKSLEYINLNYGHLVQAKVESRIRGTNPKRRSNENKHANMFKLFLFKEGSRPADRPWHLRSSMQTIPTHRTNDPAAKPGKPTNRNGHSGDFPTCRRRSMVR